MDFAFIKDRIKSYWAQSIPIAKRYHAPTLFFFLDRMWCRIVYRIGQADYDYFGFCRFNHFERKNLFNDGKFEKSCKMFFPNDMIAVLDSKKAFVQNFQEYIHRDYLLLPCNEDTLLCFAKKHEVIFAKADISCGGKGVHSYSYCELFANRALLSKIADMDGVAEQRIVQHPAMEALQATAVSTLRITTLVEKNENINIMSSGLRLGARGAGVDNQSSGGSVYEVDLAEGIVVGYGKTQNNQKSIKSPTGAVVPGFQIPFWSEVLAMVESAAKKYPRARFVGWDVAIGPDGPLLVEANRSTGASVMQFGDYGCWNYLKSQR